MKTTLNFNDALIRKAKARASERGETLTALIERAIRDELHDAPKSTPYRFKWKTVGGRTKAGVDLNSRESLLDVMEGAGDRD